MFDYLTLVETGGMPDLTGLSDAQIIDEVGELGALIKKLTAIKRALMSELPGPVRGDKYQLTEINEAKRTYNSAVILKSFAENEWTLQDLIRADAVRLTWRWSQLNRAVRDARVMVTIAQREIDDDGDLDGPMVGEVWKTKQEVRGI